jgi:hypothetical protein
VPCQLLQVHDLSEGPLGIGGIAESVKTLLQGHNLLCSLIDGFPHDTICLRCNEWVKRTMKERNGAHSVIPARPTTLTHAFTKSGDYVIAPQDVFFQLLGHFEALLIIEASLLRRLQRSLEANGRKAADRLRLEPFSAVVKGYKRYHLTEDQKDMLRLE